MKKIATVITATAFVLAALTVACNDRENEEKDDKRRLNTLNLILVPLIYGTPYTYTLTDNQDGTVLFAKTNSKSTEEITYKKCLQGQVYRPPPDNDCRGAGNAADNYNATQLQYCSTNDNSCNPRNYFVEGANSEIYVSCNTDTTAGLLWYPTVEYDLFRVSDYASIYAELPLDGQFWTGQAQFYSIYEAIYQTTEVQEYSVASFLDDKTAHKYVLCGTKMPP